MKNIQLIEMPSEICAGTRGASLGIEALKIASLQFKHPYFKKYPSIKLKDENHLLWEENKTPNAIRIEGLVKIYERLSEQVNITLNEKKFPLVLSADHASAGGTIAGIKKYFSEKRLGIIWIDAHADIHSPYTTPSGNMHGMPLATAIDDDNLYKKINDLSKEEQKYWEQLRDCGGIRPKINSEDLVYFGVRDTEKPEDYLLKKHNIKNFTVEETRRKGVEEVANEALQKLSDCDILYISFDVDSMDCDLVSHGTGTPVPNGYSPEEAKILINTLLKSKKVECFEMVEINPLLDEKKNKMAETAFNILKEITPTIIDN